MPEEIHSRAQDLLHTLKVYQDTASVAVDYIRTSIVVAVLVQLQEDIKNSNLEKIDVEIKRYQRFQTQFDADRTQEFYLEYTHKIVALKEVFLMLGGTLYGEDTI